MPCIERTLATAAALLLAACATPPTREQPVAPAVGVSAGRKIVYVDELTRLHRAEIALGLLALERGRNARARGLAQALIDDHARQLVSLRDWASGRIDELDQLHLRANTAVGGSGGAGEEEGLAELSSKLEEYAAEAREGSPTERKRFDALAKVRDGEFDRAFAAEVERLADQGRGLVRRGLEAYEGDIAFNAVLRVTDAALGRQLEAAGQLRGERL